MKPHHPGTHYTSLGMPGHAAIGGHTTEPWMQDRQGNTKQQKEVCCGEVRCMCMCSRGAEIKGEPSDSKEG